jgi:hypothetical protein
MPIAPQEFLAETSLAVKKSMRALCLAKHYADDLQCSLWDFAVEIEILRALGLTNNDFRWLLCKGYVQHREETTLAGDDGRTFRRLGNLAITKRTCVVLTEQGASFASMIGGDLIHRCELNRKDERLNENGASVDGVPHWDKDRQELRLGNSLVKRFKAPAPNQEVILAALEEEHWPSRIDDPLPPHSNQDAKRRLHDVINSLNRNQQHPLIRFMGDGSGQGVRWELIRQGEQNGRTA